MQAKHQDLDQAWVQLYRQIAAMLDELARAAADTQQQKKRTRWQVSTCGENGLIHLMEVAVCRSLTHRCPWVAGLVHHSCHRV